MGSTISTSNKEIEGAKQLVYIIDLVKKQILKELGCIHENELEKMNYTQDNYNNELYSIEFDSISLEKTLIKFSRENGIRSIESKCLYIASYSDYADHYEIRISNKESINITHNTSSFSNYGHVIVEKSNVYYSNYACTIFGKNNCETVSKCKLYPCIKKQFRNFFSIYSEEELEKTFAKLGYIDKEENGPNTLEELEKVCEKLNIEYELDFYDIVNTITTSVKSIFIK